MSRAFKAALTFVPRRMGLSRLESPSPARERVAGSTGKKEFRVDE